MHLVSAEVLNGTRKQSSLSDHNGNVHHEHVERRTHCYCYSTRIRQQSNLSTVPTCPESSQKIFDHQRSGVVYNFGRVCMSVCLSVCQTITFESLDVGSPFSHILHILMEYGSGSYMKVIGSRSRSQEQKGNNFGSI